MHDDLLSRTRRSWHAVAELVLAGPQHAACGRITLRPLPGGFGTTHSPDLRVDGGDVVAGEVRTGIDGRTARQVAEALGVVASGLDHVYRDGSGVGLDEVLTVDAAVAYRLAAAFAVGDEALRAFAPDRTPVLWPEHFDLGISLADEQLNLGVSPGDATIPAPYMYVGPWEVPPADDFWNQPFGAARALPGTAAEVVAFFEEGRRRVSR